MALWRLVPSCKKSLIERMYYKKDGSRLMVEFGWRWGEFTVETKDDKEPLIESGTNLWDCEYKVKMVELTDGCWEDHDYDGCDEEAAAWLENFFEEGNSYLDLEEHGWDQIDAEMIIDCDPEFRKLKD
jgi:hypothetical protein